MTVKLYLYRKKNVYFNLSVGQEVSGKRINMPQYNTEFVIHKGLPNRIEFSIRNHDRKSISLEEDQYLLLRMTNKKKEVKYEKELICIDSYKGLYYIDITAEETKDIESGFYLGNVLIYSYNEEYDEQPIDTLYSGVDWIPYFEILVEENKMDLIEEPQELEMVLKESIIDRTDGLTYVYSYSSIIPTIKSEYHTLTAIISEDFFGKIILEASGEDEPTHENSDWVTIGEYERIESDSDSSSDSDDYFDEAVLINTICSCKYIRVKSIVNKTAYKEDLITNILYRN